MTDQELKDLVASLARSQTETSQQQKETGRQISQVGKQIGELGNKFGRFSEGMAEPSMRKDFTQ